MLTITLGYARRNGGEPTVLYCGNDAAQGQKALLSPPAGMARTQIFKAPAAVRTRYFEVPAAEPAPPAEPAPAKPAKPKATVQKDLLSPSGGDGE
jgi:hypothetical protein